MSSRNIGHTCLDHRFAGGSWRDRSLGSTLGLITPEERKAGVKTQTLNDYGHNVKYPCPKQGIIGSINLSRTKWVVTKLSRSASAEDFIFDLLAAIHIHHPRTWAKINGATMVASDSMMNLGVFTPSLPQVIFSFGTAPE